MKSNIEYLKEAIKKSSTDPESWVDDCYEWIEAIEVELKGNKDEFEDRIKDLKGKVNGLEIDMAEMYDSDDFETINCGIGEIKYLQPDNLKLQLMMDDFKAQHELSLQTLPKF